MLGRFLRWRQERAAEREIEAYGKQSDARTNKEFTDAYKAFPVSLLAVVSADLYVGGDIGALDRHLSDFLPPGQFGNDGRDGVHDFLRAAEASLGGGAGTHGSYYNALESGWPLSQKVDWLPSTVQSIHLLLRTLSTGIVMFGIFAVPSSRHPDLAKDVFEGSHSSPRVRERRGTVTYTVDAAKTIALRRGLERMLEFGIFPAGTGLLQGRRYPAGSMVIWDVPALPNEADQHWRDVQRVLEVDDWNRWDGEKERLYRGLPIGHIGSFWDRQTGGWSLLTTRAGGGGNEDVVHSVRYELMHFVGEWFSWPVALQAAAQVSQEADRLRASLDRERSGAFRFLRVGTLEPIVDSLQKCDYHLSRLKQATSPLEKRYVNFPKLVEGGPIVEMRRSRSAGKDSAIATEAASAERPRTTFADALSSWIEGVIENGLQDARLSLGRASTLVQLRTNAAMRAWTIILVLLTAAVVGLTVAVVLIASRTGH
ncbi:MAG: hypothetical protein M3082_03615 [Candidatus Dormibacteraeota bacterium]|nr:hypothetical protein [Candidatus Dormibacteraeota bacterium]